MNARTASVAKPLAVAPIGLDARQRAALELVFKVQCKDAFRMDESQQALAWIVDLDNVHSTNLLRDREAQGGWRPALYLSTRESNAPTDGRGLFLRKPFRLQNFVASMQQLAQLARHDRSDAIAPPTSKPTVHASIKADALAPRVDAHATADSLAAEQHRPFVGMAADVNLDDPACASVIYYNPDHYLQGQVARAWMLAETRQVPVALSAPWPQIRVCPERAQAGLELDHHKLRPYAAVPNPVASDAMTKLRAGADLGREVMAFDSLMWRLALWASRGRLPEGTALDIPIFIRFWPNFTRLELTPFALAITALWANKPHTLKDTAAILGAPQRFVFAFYSAAHALNLAAPTSRAVDHLFAPEPLSPPPQRGLLRRFLDRLRS